VSRRAASTGSGTDRWLVSYADLMTLLLAFFATLYAMSEVRADKAVASAASVASVVATSTPSPAAVQAAADLRDALASALEDAIDAGQVDVFQDARGVVLSLPEGATFREASADVMPAAEVLLTTIAETIAPLAAEVRVEGHTDDVPIRTPRFASNWELSTGRASAVVALFIARGMEPRRLSAAGYGEFHPRASNADAEGRARNRRVDLILVSSGNV
jgi:chemotaxis protein MotB